MASRTQLRVQQLTGSLIDLAFSGSTSSAANPAALVQSDLGAVLGSFAGAIGRISGKSGTGASAFTNQAAGVFSHGTIKLGGDGDELEIRESGGDITFDVTTADKDIVFTHNTTATGDNTEIFRIDGSQESILMGSDNKIEFGGTSTSIRGDNTDVTIEGTNLNINAGIDTTNQATNLLVIDNNANAFSFDSTDRADILKIDSTDGSEKVVVHALDVTNDLTVSGDFVVQGASTLLTSSNTIIQDAIIAIGTSGSDGSVDSFAPAGVDRGIIFGVGASHAKQPAVFHDASEDAFVMATVDVGPSSSSFGDTDYGELAELRVGLLALDFDGTNSISSNDTDLTAASGGKVILDSNGNIELNADSGVIQMLDDSATLFTFAANEIDVASGDLKLDVAGDIILDADGDEIKLRFGATNDVGQFKNVSNALILSGGHAGKNLGLESNSGTIDIRELENVGGILKSDLNNALFIVSGATGNNLVLGSNERQIDFEIAESTKLMLSQSQGEVILSSAAGDQLILASNDGKVGIKGHNTSGGLAGLLEFDLGSGDNAQAFANVNIDGFNTLRMFGNPGSERLIVSGTHLALSGGATAQELRFFEPTSAGEQYVALKAPDTLGANLTFKLPNADASASGQALISDGAGNLSFAAVGASASSL